MLIASRGTPSDARTSSSNAGLPVNPLEISSRSVSSPTIRSRSSAPAVRCLNSRPRKKSRERSESCSNTMNSSRSTFAAKSAPSSIPIGCPPSIVALNLGCFSIAAILTVNSWSGATHLTMKAARYGWTSRGTLLHSSSSSHTRRAFRPLAMSRRDLAMSPKFKLVRSLPVLTWSLCPAWPPMPRRQLERRRS